MQCLCLLQCPTANLKLWTKGHDKLIAGVAQESHKVLWYKFPMGGHDPSKHRERKADRDEGQVAGQGGSMEQKYVCCFWQGQKGYLTS
jgi:hypothetical protein